MRTDPRIPLQPTPNGNLLQARRLFVVLLYVATLKKGPNHKRSQLHERAYGEY